MNTQEYIYPKISQSTNKQSGKANIAGIIGIIIAIGLIVGATMVQSKAAPAGTIDANVPPITAADHTRGDLNAPVKVIEYSDLECPFCKTFHATMLEIYKEYGVSNQILWVYRHFPLTQLHHQAKGEAIAVECAAKAAGPARANEAFWTMTDEIFRTTNSNDGLNLSTLPNLAVKAGADRAEYLKCYNSAETASIVEEQMAGGAAAGAQGTPYTLVISPNGNVFEINGAYPYDKVKETIEKALADN